MFHSVFTEILLLLTMRTVSRMSELHAPNTCFGKLGVSCRSLLHSCSMDNIKSAVSAFGAYVSIYYAPSSSSSSIQNYSDTGLPSTNQVSAPPDPQPAASTCGGPPSPWRRAPESLPTATTNEKEQSSHGCPGDCLLSLPSCSLVASDLAKSKESQRRMLSKTEPS